MIVRIFCSFSTQTTRVTDKLAEVRAVSLGLVVAQLARHGDRAELGSRMLPRVVNGREEGHGSTTAEPFSVPPRIDEHADAARSFAVNRNATRRTAGRDFHAAEPNTARPIAPEGSTGRDRNSARPRCFRQLGSRRCPKADGEHDAH